MSTGATRRASKKAADANHPPPPSPPPPAMSTVATRRASKKAANANHPLFGSPDLLARVTECVTDKADLLAWALTCKAISDLVLENGKLRTPISGLVNSPSRAEWGVRLGLDPLALVSAAYDAKPPQFATCAAALDLCRDLPPSSAAWIKEQRAKMGTDAFMRLVNYASRWCTYYPLRQGGWANFLKLSSIAYVVKEATGKAGTSTLHYMMAR